MPENKYRRKPMVNWYAPGELLETAGRTMVSIILGERLDSRVINTSGEHDDNVYRYSEKNEIYFDYASDTGDGWDSTYSIAKEMSRSHVSGESESMKGSDFAILGGDEVYPVASQGAYERRLEAPFEKAAQDLKVDVEQESELTDLFCIPGNHDWYDSLVSFTARFCNGRDSNWPMGRFRPRQSRSYFHLVLPHGWHVWAADIQLGKNIDVEQYKFFEDCTKDIKQDDTVILCTAEPGVVNGEEGAPALMETFGKLEKMIADTGASVRLRLSGDIHNYQRYERVYGEDEGGEDGRLRAMTQLVSGGGGAFLHPTHGFPEPKSEDKWKLENTYPVSEISARLNKRNLWFPIKHPKMSFLFGTLLVAMLFPITPSDSAARLVLEHPIVVLIGLIILYGSMLFSLGGGMTPSARQGLSPAQKTKRSKLKASGLLLGVVMIAGAVGIWNITLLELQNLIQSSPVSSGWEIALQCGVRFFAWLLISFWAGIVFGLYLYLSYRFLGNHGNEAFSALSWPHHKHFLRCHIDEKGVLNISVMACDLVQSDQSNIPAEFYVWEKLKVHKHRETELYRQQSG